MNIAVQNLYGGGDAIYTSWISKEEEGRNSPGLSKYFCVQPKEWIDLGAPM